jgi:hypothetical protein
MPARESAADGPSDHECVALRPRPTTRTVDQEVEPMARRTLIVGISLFAFLVAGTASAGSGGGSKGGRDRTAPSIAIAAPAVGSTVAGLVAAAGTAADNVKVAKVEVSVDGGAFVLAQGTSSWSFALNTSSYADGAHTLRARATDSNGNTSTTSESVGFKNAAPDTTPPSLTIGSPAAGATVSGSVTVSGVASDAGGVAGVALSVDGGLYQAATGTATWTTSVDTRSLADGTRVFRVQALDAAGNAATSSVSVAVRNDFTAPSVSIAAPLGGSTIAGTVTAAGTASDNVAVAKVEVAVDAGAFQPVAGTTSWSSPINTASYANGGHTISVRVTDASGNVSTASVAVTVQNGLPAGVAQQLVTPEGVTIQIYSDVAGWTAQQVYDLLRPNALELGRIGPTLTVRVQTQYSSQTTTGASSSGGTYSSYHATIYLQATASSVFTFRPDYVVAHEYGHAWTMYHLYISHAGDWGPYLQARGVLSDPRLDSTPNWSRNEMIADDYRMLFGTAAAVSQSGYINSEVPDPRQVAGLRDFFLNFWAMP